MASLARLVHSLALLLAAASCLTPTKSSEASGPDASARSEGGVAADATVPVDAGTSGCEAPIVAPPATLGLAPSYAKYLDASGIAVVGSARPSDAALRQACKIVTKMVSFRVDVRDEMIAHRARIAVMARTERTTDVPEHADLYEAFPGTDWNVRARGLGGTVERPATSCAEENLLCDRTDPYVGENILVHELAHGMVNLGAVFADKTFARRLRAAFDDAIAAGKWKDTYAGSNVDEYFAEGVQSYFDTNIAVTPPNGIHNEIRTRAALATYDPALHGLVAELYGPERWTPTCP